MNKGLIAAFCLEAIALGAIATLALDMRAHKRVETLGGVNAWGYRGPVMNRKQPNEIRIAVAGGDLAFGFGVASSETLAMFVRRLVTLDLDRPGSAVKLVTAVNIGAQGLPPGEYAAWIERFAYLRPDVICLLPDPKPHQLHEARYLPNRRSLAFTAFGYSPILPLTVAEKSDRTHSSLLRTAGALLARADSALSVTADTPLVTSGDALSAATSAAASAATMGVVVVAPPYDESESRLPSNGARVRVVSLAAVPDLKGDRLKLDGFHFSVGGHSRAADAVAPAVLELIHAAERGTR